MDQVEKRNKTFASLFQENHNPNKGIPFFKVENQEDVVQIEYEDVLM